LQVTEDLTTVVKLLQPCQPRWLQQPLRIIVFIDDLDRCRPSKVVEVLEAVNLVLGPSGIMAVAGMVRCEVECT
jgi:predicted KAP-like P-loop ATPase